MTAPTGRPIARSADCNVGEILSDQGRLDEAEGHLQRARRVWSATGERQAVAFVDVLLTRLAVRRGSCPDGVRTLEQAAAELHKSGADVFAGFARALVAEAHAFTGDAARALEVARRELETSGRHRPLLQRVSGIALARLGRVDEADEQLRISLASAREAGSRLRGRRDDRRARFARSGGTGHAPRPRRDHGAAEDRTAARPGALGTFVGDRPARARVLPIAQFPPTLPASANSRSRPNATTPRHIRGDPGRGP